MFQNKYNNVQLSNIIVIKNIFQLSLKPRKDRFGREKRNRTVCSSRKAGHSLKQVN